MKKTFNCIFCDISFERYIPPSDKKGFREFCSRSCQMKFQKRKQNPECSAGEMCIVCEECGVAFSRYVKTNQKPKFCSKKCASVCTARGQRTYDAIYARWVEKFGELEANVRLKKLKKRKSELAIERNTGLKHSEDTKEKISKSCTGIPNSLKGKSFIEFYGPNRAKELSQQHSESLKEGFASGRIKPTARTPSAQEYKGVYLRSKLEKQVIEKLESLDEKLILNQTLIYEDPNTRVLWFDEDGKSHTYHPDLHDLVNDIVYEIKPEVFVVNPTYEMLAKEKAVKNSGKQFCYLTERFLKKNVVETV